jgi:hypothetical protein
MKLEYLSDLKTNPRRWGYDSMPYGEIDELRLKRFSGRGVIVLNKFPKTTPINAAVSLGYLFDIERQERNTIAARLERELKSLQSYGVQIDQFREVRQYIQDFPDIIDLLTPIVDTLEETFVEPHTITIDLYVDPEEEDRYLRILVRMGEYAEGVMDRISAAVADFQEIIARLNGYLLVTTDFGLPRG